MSNSPFTIQVIALPKIMNNLVNLFPIEDINEVSIKYPNKEYKHLCYRFLKLDFDLFKNTNWLAERRG